MVFSWTKSELSLTPSNFSVNSYNAASPRFLTSSRICRTDASRSSPAMSTLRVRTDLARSNPLTTFISTLHRRAKLVLDQRDGLDLRRIALDSRGVANEQTGGLENRIYDFQVVTGDGPTRLGIFNQEVGIFR